MSALVKVLQAIYSDEPFSASRNFLVSAIFWLVLGTVAGLTAAALMVWPDLTYGVGELTFGRLRPVHINGVLIGWLSMGYVSCMFYLATVLSGRKSLWSERLGNITMIAWNLVMVFGLLSISKGITEAREYAELVAPFDWAVLLALILTGVNVYLTVLTGEEKKWYVSLWYFMGALFWFPIVYIIGNRTFVSFEGLNDAIAGWFYGHNILGMWFTVGGVGILYYLLPKYTGNPLYSHTLSMIGFWTIGMFYAPTGTHHVLQAPVPEWLKSIAVISSVFLLVPVLTVLVNFFQTMKGKWHLAADHLPLRFAVAAGISYLLTCIQGPFQATRSINWYLHFSHWVVGHAHLALFATFSFIVFSATYFMIPRITGKKIYSRPLAIWHFWLSLIGWIVMLLGLTIAGLIQAAGWHHAIPVDQWAIEMEPYMLVRFISGILIVAGQVLFMINIYKTVFDASAEQVPHSPTGIAYV
ncbi:MAG: cbb3-type cytochrome c oxidase subunit I [Candidatus Melainabacteria bacterium]|nr:cbb3-type cytochrome c oxidase subunit I [Candidatus Melainabacteria bacterium]